MQGLLDQYTLASNEKGLDVVLRMADYFSNRVKNLVQIHTIQRHWEAMNEETGGFNDVMYQLYTITVTNLTVIDQSWHCSATYLGFWTVRLSASLQRCFILPAERSETPDDGSSFRQAMLPRTTWSPCQFLGSFFLKKNILVWSTVN